MDNDDGANNNDYGNEDYDPNNGNEGGDDGQNNNGNGGNEENVDQYFDDAGDVGYLPADHVRNSR